MKRPLSPHHQGSPRRARISRRHPRAGASKLLALALAALFAIAIVAPIGQASEGQPETLSAQIQKANRAAVRAAERASRAAQKAAQKIAEQQRRAAQREARRQAQRLARYQSREAIRLSLKEKEGNVVTIDCSTITAAYHNFAAVPGAPNEVVEWIAIKNPPPSLSEGPINFPPRIFKFEGTEGTDVVPIAFPVGHYVIDIHAKWDTNGHKGNYDIHGNVTCVPAPAYTVQKLQSIAGSGQGPTSETLSGRVGQVIDYQITVANTGNTPLTFTEFKDPRCDPGTIVGGSLSPIEPTETLTFDCSHTLTAADRSAGSYRNVATVAARPEELEGPPITHESNTVVVTPIAPGEEAKEEKPAEKPAPKEETKPKSEVLGTTTTNTTNAAVTTGSTGVLGFTSASVPSLKGPQGCVRSAFVASIRATGVSSVIFYLDGHRLTRLTYKNARRGMLTVRIDPTKLKIGAHRLIAAITMKSSAPSAKAARASRRLTVIRCKSASVTPHFTG